MAESIRSPSPPLPPDPAPVSSRANTSEETPRGSVIYQQATPSTPSRKQTQPDLGSIDTTRNTQQPAQISPILQREPIKDAVNEAFEHAPATNQLDPELIKQVTEQVIKSLQAAGTAAATPTAAQPQPQPQFAPPPSQEQEPRSPTQSSIDSPPPGRYTPPTPERNREAREDRTASVEDAPSDDESTFSRGSTTSVRSRESLKSAETPRPYQPDPVSAAQRTNDTARRRSGTIPQDTRLGREGSISDSTARERTPFRRDSKDPDVPLDGASRGPVRPPPDVEETPLEKFWQPLFINGKPTMRLGQFLRGLALHLIDDCEPKNSLVVTPKKMLTFLNDTRVDTEHYPWETIFGGSMSPQSISVMFQKLLCQHHLIQDRYDRVPSIPGLTPYGFEYFMTCLIQAHPDTEFERLAKTVMNMPISNADNKSERFPKELSRRLFPAQANIQAEQRMISSLNHEQYVIANLKGISHMPPPPPPPSAPPNYGNERERMPYSSSSQASNVFDDDDLNAPPIQIERERKPYTAKEGSGKTYEDGRSNTNQLRPDNSQFNNARSMRATSAVPTQSSYASSSGPSDPVSIPPRNTHRMSNAQGPPPMANGGYPRSSRRSPPPMKGPLARSEGEFVGSIPNSQYASNLHPSYPRDQYAGEPDDEQLRRYNSRSRGPQNDDDTNNGRGYPIPNRGVPIANGFEYGGGPSVGDPRQPGGIPVGSYGSRRNVGNFGGDDRRRSMFPTMGGDGGTDGYGSFAGGLNGGPGYPPQQSYGSSMQH